jgi:hydrogenase maturation protease
VSILVLGIGNILLGDEGIGPHVVTRLQNDYLLPESVSVVDGGTSGMDLLDMVASHDRLLIVDCAELDSAPGTVRELVGTAVPAFFNNRISPHQIGLSDLLAGAALIGALPGELALIAVQPQSCELDLELSPTAKKAAEEAMQVLLARLASWSVPCAPREAA